MRYQAGRVHTGFGSFQTGPLSPAWEGPKIRQKQLVYEQDDWGATILTDALCGPKFSEAPLSRLASDLFHSLGSRKNVQVERDAVFRLGGRQALRRRGMIEMDGVALMMDVVVMKKDFCQYDFVYFAPPLNFSKGEADFEGYFRGFKTR